MLNDVLKGSSAASLLPYQGLSRFEARLPLQTGNAVEARGTALATQLPMNPYRSIRLAAIEMDSFDLAQQRAVCS